MTSCEIICVRSSRESELRQRDERIRWSCRLCRTSNMLRLCRRLVAVFATSALLIALLTHSVTLPFRDKLQHVHPQWSEQSERSAEKRSRAFYPWIDDSGRSLNGTKPPVYGLFMLLDMDRSSYQAGDRLHEAFAGRDFGFSNYRQVTMFCF